MTVEYMGDNLLILLNDQRQLSEIFIMNEIVILASLGVQIPESSPI